jgi:sulfatase maturation enzyme AslB (radical SAM superfamily)
MERLPIQIRSNVNVRAGSFGLHLFNRKTGLNVLLDEVQVPECIWASAPRQISFALTNRCDLSCPYCYAPKSRASLDPLAVIGWLDELNANGCFGIGFGGGEPTLYRHFPMLCQYATQNTKLAVTFTTHAHRIDEALAAKLRGSVHFIRVSMDGVGKTYEELRGRSFTALRAHLKIIRALAPFGINYVVNNRTLPDLDKAITLAVESGAQEFLLLPEHPVRGVGGIDPATLGALQCWVWQYAGVLPLTISEAAADGMPACQPILGETGLNAFAHVDATGTLKPSSYDENGVLIGPGGLMETLAKLRAPASGGKG